MKISDTKFIEMCFDAPVQKIIKAIKSGANVNAKDEDGVMPLMLASVNNTFEVVEVLLQAGADVNASDNNGMTPLMLASWKNTADVVKILIKSGADVNAVNEDKYTALVLAAEFNAPTRAMRMITYIEEDKAISFTFDKLAEVEKNAFEITKALLEAGANPKYKDKGGYSVLMAASKTASAEIIKELIKAGADINARSKGGLTALILAARSNPNPAVIDAMLDAGADVKIKDRKGKTAAYYAAKNDSIIGTETLKRLEELSK